MQCGRRDSFSGVTIVEWGLRPAVAADVDAIAELRAVVLRPDLERLGRFDEVRVRQRLRNGFDAQYTSVITYGREFAGSVALRPDGDGRRLEHFYLAPELQGRGIGSAVLRRVLSGPEPVRLNVLAGSAAIRLYERHGFTVEAQDPVDVFMVRR